MKDPDTSPPRQRPISDDDVARLVLRAGQRPQLTEAEAGRLREAALGAWESQVRKRRTRQWTVVTALAASLVAGLSVAWWITTGPAVPGATPVAVASVIRINGAAGIGGADVDATAARTGQSLFSGDRVTVPEGNALAMRLDNGMEVRLAGGTGLVTETAERLRLDHGRVYIDSGTGQNADSHILVRTPEVSVRDIGTRFLVATTAGQTRVLVREGKVEVHGDGPSQEADAGEALAIDAQGNVDRGYIAPDADEWRWIEAVTANPEVDGHPVMELLEWVARETGKTLSFSNAAIEADARRIVLRGTIGNLTPMQSLDAMLNATDLDYVLTADGGIVVTRRIR